ncbi:GmrSD restriction endonuclease domain-containing protein [Bifidobacterium thermophilum]|uniref:GmrSD restriction endonuclease domain-containing protein n=1 Tax=Bifidobacterium thermophilum TaxID=33905 RepID=UPI0030A1B3B8
MAISAFELPLGKVFTSDYQLSIPSFQRAYSWRPGNVLQLLDDVRSASQTQETPYFLGSLILVHDEGRDYEVIDGQQRLVSLTIIIAALRELEDDPALVHDLTNLILEPGDRLRHIEAAPRLTLRERDADFFTSYVQEGNLESLFDLRDMDMETNAQRNIHDNAQAAYDNLAGMDAQERRRLASYLVNKVTLVIVTTDDLQGAHRVFDVMNMRGMPLTVSDVFKSKAVSAIEPTQQDQYAARWDDIMDPLGDDPASCEAFFRDLHLVVSHKVECSRLIDQFVGDVLNPRIGTGKIEPFIDDILAAYACAWRIVEQPTGTNLPPQVVSALVALRDYPNDDWKPIAMWALVHSIRNLGDRDVAVFRSSAGHARFANADHDGMAPDAHDLDRLMQVLHATDRAWGVDCLNRVASVQRRTRAATTVRDLEKGIAPNAIAGLRVDQAAARLALIRMRGEMPNDPALPRLLLIRANEQKSGYAISRPRSLSAVHIMPEPTGKDDLEASWTQADLEYWAERLGNMALSQSSDERMSGFTTFAQRRASMLALTISQQFPLTRELEDIGTCTPQTLAARQRDTIALIARYWRLPFDGDADQAIPAAADHTPAERIGNEPPARNSRRVTISAVLRAGLLTPGERLTWQRPRKGELWVAEVTPQGRLRMEDGKEYTTPTAAARAVGGASAGLNVWKRSDGTSLADIWKQYRSRK